jgi:hypothetical protein
MGGYLYKISSSPCVCMNSYIYNSIFLLIDIYCAIYIQYATLTIIQEL